MATGATKNMPYVRLGNSGLKVSKIILGMMSYGSKSWASWVLGQEECTAHVKAAYEAGIQTFDTANVYSNGLSEIMLGNAIKELKLPREEIVVLTKVYFTMGHTHDINTIGIADPEAVGYVNQRGLSRKHIFDSVQASLKRLQLDYIDVLQCHRFDVNTPIEETMQALHDVVKAGWVRYIGMSSCYAYQFQAMQNYAITHNLTPFISMQNHYNLLYREEEREMFPTLNMFGVGSIPWSPLARGLLTRPVDAESTLRGNTDGMLARYNRSSDPHVTIVNRVEELAKKKGVSLSQIAVAWILAKPGVSAPIVGTTKLENLHDLVKAVHLKLTDEEVKYLEEPYVPQGIVGH